MTPHTDGHYTHSRAVRVMTHCNTGSLATAGYGTALGVIRSLQAAGRLERVYCTETRPYNQGARLTAFELVQDKLPGTLVTDSMASFLMATKGLDAVVVGADRIAGNGDTANKIGTYQLVGGWSIHQCLRERLSQSIDCCLYLLSHTTHYSNQLHTRPWRASTTAWPSTWRRPSPPST